LQGAIAGVRNGPASVISMTVDRWGRIAADARRTILMLLLTGFLRGLGRTGEMFPVHIPEEIGGR
jgi:hypothetical protein